MRVWVDITAPPHVLVFRPLIELLRSRGDDVEVTAREHGETLPLLALHGIAATVIGRHGGRSRAAKLGTMATRLGALVRWARGRRFDVALAAASHHLPLAARMLRIPSATTFDYEFAAVQHQLACRAASVVLVPEAIPAERIERYGARPPKLRRYPGLKEEYYLADFEPDAGVLEGLRLDPARVIVVVRTPSDFAMYHRRTSPLFPALLRRLGHADEAQTVVLPRTAAHREEIRSLGLPAVTLPDGAVDAQSLIALSDLVVSAGGTMNREAAALGVPVYTTFGGRLGAVDEALVRKGRLRRLTDPQEIALRKRGAADRPALRKPEQFLDLLLP